MSLWPTPSRVDILAEHDDNYSQAYESGDTKKCKVIDFENILRLLGNREFKSILEVGCANAYITEYCLDRGLVALGIDIDEKLIKMARERIGKDKVILGNFDTNEFKNKFDLLVMIDLIEHIDEPFRFLERARSLLHKNGRVVIITPNIDTIKRKIFKRHWTGYYLEHPSCLSFKSIDYLAKHANFKVLIKHSFHKTVSLQYFVSKLSFKFPFFRFMNNIVKASGCNPLFKINDDSMIVVLENSLK